MSHIESLELYAETLRLQAQLYSLDTRSVLSSLQDFRNARTILEVGCGPGAQAEMISDLLFGKKYFAVDVVPEFIMKAKEKFRKYSEFSFSVEDILKFSPPTQFDFVLSFAVLQHLPDTREALEKYFSFIKPGGVLAIYDSNAKEELQSYPMLGSLQELYRSLSEEQTSGKRKSHCLDDALDFASEKGLEIVLRKQSDYLVNDSGARDIFVRYVRHVVDLVEIKYKKKPDRIRFDQELETWRIHPDSWVRLTGGSWLVLKK